MPLDEPEADRREREEFEQRIDTRGRKLTRAIVVLGIVVFPFVFMWMVGLRTVLGFASVLMCLGSVAFAYSAFAKAASFRRRAAGLFLVAGVLAATAWLDRHVIAREKWIQYCPNGRANKSTCR